MSRVARGAAVVVAAVGVLGGGSGRARAGGPGAEPAQTENVAADSSAPVVSTPTNPPAEAAPAEAPTVRAPEELLAPGTARKGAQVSISATLGMGVPGLVLVMAPSVRGLGLVLLAGAAVAGPSVGSFATGHPGRALAFMASRALVSIALFEATLATGLAENSDPSTSAVAAVGIVLGALVVAEPAVGYVWDRGQERRPDGPPIALVPAVMAPAATGEVPAGLALAGSF